jgi:hypothetical protein
MKGELTITFCSDPGEHTKPMNVPLIPPNYLNHKRSTIIPFLVLWCFFYVLMKVIK